MRRFFNDVRQKIADRGRRREDRKAFEKFAAEVASIEPSRKLTGQIGASRGVTRPLFGPAHTRGGGHKRHRKMRGKA